MKTCTRCHEAKPLDAFVTNQRRGKPYPRSKCRQCNAAVTAIRNERYKEAGNEVPSSNPEYRRAYSLWTRYGMTIQDYEDMLARQDGHCALCQRVPLEGERRLRCFRVLGGPVLGITCYVCSLRLYAFEKDPWHSRARTFLAKVAA